MLKTFAKREDGWIQGFLAKPFAQKKVKAIKFREYKRNRHKLFSLLFDKKEEIRPVTKKTWCESFYVCIKVSCKEFSMIDTTSDSE